MSDELMSKDEIRMYGPMLVKATWALDDSSDDEEISRPYHNPLDKVDPEIREKIEQEQNEAIQYAICKGREEGQQDVYNILKTLKPELFTKAFILEFIRQYNLYCTGEYHMPLINDNNVYVEE